MEIMFDTMCSWKRIGHTTIVTIEGIGEVGCATIKIKDNMYSIREVCGRLELLIITKGSELICANSL